MTVDDERPAQMAALPEKKTKSKGNRAPVEGDVWKNSRDDPSVLEAARQVHFDPEALNQAFTKHRKGRVYRQSVNASTEWMTPEDIGENVEAAGTVPPEATYDDFLRAYPEDTLDEALFNLDAQDLNHDLLERLEDNAKACAGVDGPCFPFEPWTEDGKKAWPNVSGVVGDDFFGQAVREHPEELYQELKLRTLLALGLRQQRNDLHTYAKGASELIHSLLNWIHHLNGPNSSAAHIVADLLAQNQEKDEQISELNATIAAMAIKRVKPRVNPTSLRTVELDDDRDEAPTTKITHRRGTRAARSETRETRASIRETLEREHRDATAAGESTKSSKTTKIPDPPTWHNDPAKDEIDFTNWIGLMEGKLMMNSDHYPTELAKIIYIRSRLTGNAARQMRPYFPDRKGPGTAGTISTHEELLDRCREEWGDPHEAEEARQAFRNLRYKPGDDWKVFKNDFVRYAGESNRPRDEWKAELKDKIEIPSLLLKLADDFDDPEVSFNDICDKCSRRALMVKMLKKRDTTAQSDENRGRRSTPANPRGRKENPVQPRASTPVSQKANAPPKLSKDDVARHMASGTCFICNERGHISRDCPKNPRPHDQSYQQRHEARVNAVYERLYGEVEEELESENE
jgi:hypothetical protein